MKNLIIVESPAKARTIKNFLGGAYNVIASKGHIRDLPKHTFGIKIENEVFTPEYTIDASHKEVVSELKKLAKDAKEIYIATDEDREGEAIGYHIATAIGKEPSKLPRIVFHEITQKAIEEALKNPRHIDMDRVNAQQARRLLDRIVGYRLSPLIASKIQKGLSAGRVQSSALKIVVDREKEILNFIPITYYTIDSIFKKSGDKSDIEAELVEFKGKKIGKLTLQDSTEAGEIVSALKRESFSIKNIETKRRKTPTPPPFMTSTLQQSASSQLGFSPSRTMQTAQKLYEGVMTHKGSMGVITYMRTDSLNIAKIAQDEARACIAKSYGKEYVPAKPKVYATKSKGAQEAHEAIRPTLMDFTPQIAARYLKGDELKLYTLIYKRFLASQMQDAEFESQNILIGCGVAQLKISGRKLVFDGFYHVLGNEDKDKLLPEFSLNEKVKLEKCASSKHETEPPARYSEASLIKTLESLGIGRPSTYAPTISLLTSREYISIEKKQIKPQEIAFKVVELLEAHFNEIVDSKFTANLEERLDAIADSKQDWQQLLWEFYEPFIQKISEGKTNIASQKIAIPLGEFCPLCGKELVQRKSRFGEFVGCSGYPKCKYIKREQAKDTEVESFGVCEKCGKSMVKKRGRNGEFLACSGYPECKNTKALNGSKLQPKILEGIKCPKCGDNILERMGRRGKFYGCGNYPKCDFIANFPPTKYTCPKCKGVMARRTFRKKPILECIACKERIDDPEV
ncbi:type I DNA topoisomerase [Helicobacter turcicus]|uniref:DNA topoisomerase 1 n=1 Tax=Helicobacter turcicus TaxID=2867412 RepID=A0ABS7JQ09_9HELI|nr:type I DNA topoisomerase [Helicobacter turcicus]MBX7491479.1 type I DNA topoisomerase [Helicobacter turcicus]MBX7546336.1 type I DNA topoisomerase [Helicobacter turcicus]